MTNLKRSQETVIADLITDEFKRYLSFRPDLLPLTVRSEWAALPIATPMLQASDVRQIIERELNRSVESAFAFFTEDPIESRLCFQSHRAWLQSGEAVTLKVRRPAVAEYLAENSSPWAQLENAFADRVTDRQALGSAVADYQQLLLRRMDFAQEMAALRVLREEAREFSVLVGPVVHTAFCTPGILVVGQWLGSDPLVPEGADADVADSLCLVWLRQSLLGRTFPLEPELADFASVPPRRIGISGGVFGSLPLEVKLNLRGYMASVTAGDPDRACECLLREMTLTKSSTGADDFRRRFKYATPFRDSTWSDPIEDNLIEHVLVHWELAHQYGYRPNSPLLMFYRGLLHLTAATQKLCLGRDVLREAWQGLRSQIILSDLRQMADQNYWTDNFEKYARLVSTVGEGLEKLAGSGILAPERLLQIADPGAGRRKASIVSGIVLLLVLVSFTLLATKLTDGLGAWGQIISVIVFAAVGIALLWEVIRR